jgi:hypothetical protein
MELNSPGSQYGQVIWQATRINIRQESEVLPRELLLLLLFGIVDYE